MTEKDEVFTVDQFRRKYKISRNLAYDGVKKGQIPHIRIGRRILIPAAALRKLEENAGNSD